jgi:CO dehydrogenase/acetyl-CoA synthase beta subunit
MEVRVVDYRRDVKNTRQGYFTLAIDGVMVKKCVAHKHPGGKVWFAPPAIQRPDGGYENVVQLDPQLNEKVQIRVAEELQRYIQA